MQKCSCGGIVNGWGDCSHWVCGICGRHYTDSGYHVRRVRGTRFYPCGHEWVSIQKARGAVRKHDRFNREYEAALASLARWNAARA